MIKKIFICISIFSIAIAVSSCGGGDKSLKKDTGDRYAKSQTRGAIIERSGTTFSAGSDKKRKRLQMQDAQNRLRTGGGLFGKNPTDLLELGGGLKNNKQQIGTVGFPINPYLWRGSLETISFMPLASADPFAGVIITDWYNSENNNSERCKLNIFIKGVDLKTENLRVNTFCQTLDNNGSWINQEVSSENNIKLENAILNQAKKIKLSQS